MFGKVISGRSTIRLIEEGPSKNDSPSEDVIIVDCGELAADEPLSVPDLSGDGHEEYPSDDEEDVHDVGRSSPRRRESFD